MLAVSSGVPVVTEVLVSPSSVGVLGKGFSFRLCLCDREITVFFFLSLESVEPSNWKVKER